MSTIVESSGIISNAAINSIFWFKEKLIIPEISSELKIHGMLWGESYFNKRESIPLEGIGSSLGELRSFWLVRPAFF